MGYTGTKIIGANSPDVGADRSTYAAVFDLLAQVLDLHDHSTNKGAQITATGLANLAVTQAKLALLAVGTPQLIDLAVTQAKLALLAVGTGQLIDGAATFAKQGATHSAVTLSSGGFTSGANPSSVPVTNLSQVFTATAGSFVHIQLLPDQSGSLSTVSGDSNFTVELFRDIGAGPVNIQTAYLQSGAQSFPPSAFIFEDLSPGVTANTYSIRTSATGSTEFAYVVMRVTEKK